MAVHCACQSLLNGECDMALAGGVAITVPQQAGYVYQEGGILSPDGHCRAFDARAQGTVGGSGVGIVVLKRLADAMSDGDNILALIKGSATNNDGAAKAGFTAPGVDGQAAVIAEALAVAGVHPETLTYIEAHGTGTALGDPIEIKALTQAFRAQTDKTGFCAIGSVKTNIGHLDTAAGIAGLIKTVLALQHKSLPPSLHFQQPNPQIDFAHSPFYVNTRLTAWQTEQWPRRAGVSALGIGGSNAHVILEEAPLHAAASPSRACHLLLLSAHTDTALTTAATQLTTYLQQQPDVPLADVAYTLQVGRRAFRHRCMVVCQSRAEAITALQSHHSKSVLRSIQETRERPVVFMFPGQGSQHVNMGLALYRHETVFREQVDYCATLLTTHLGLDLRQVLYPPASQAATAAQQLLQTHLAQPALFVVEYALAQLWMSWGIQPQAMIGHSLGEYVAACLAGVFSVAEALALVAARGRLMQQLPGGAMLAVALAEEESVGFALLVQFRETLLVDVFAAFLSRCQMADPDFFYAWRNQETPLRLLLSARLPELLPDPGRHPHWAAFLRATLGKSLARLRRDYRATALEQLTWGRVNTADIAHPLATALPLLGRLLNMPRQPLPGCAYCVRTTGTDWGAAERLVVSPGRHHDGILHMPGGQAGHPLSPHYRDQHRFWVQGAVLPFLPGPTLHTLRLEPASDAPYNWQRTP